MLTVDVDFSQSQPRSQMNILVDIWINLYDSLDGSVTHQSEWGNVKFAKNHSRGSSRITRGSLRWPKKSSKEMFFFSRFLLVDFFSINQNPEHNISRLNLVGFSRLRIWYDIPIFDRCNIISMKNTSFVDKKIFWKTIKIRKIDFFNRKGMISTLLHRATVF